MTALYSEVERVGEDSLQDSVILFIRTLRQIQMVKCVYSSWCTGHLNIAQVKQFNRPQKITLRWFKKHFFVQSTVENILSSVQYFVPSKYPLYFKSISSSKEKDTNVSVLG